MFFARYDQDGNFVFTTEETNKILSDITHDRVDKPPALQSASTSSRPRSGKEARSARSARIHSAASQDRRKSQAGMGGVSGEEYEV